MQVSKAVDGFLLSLHAENKSQAYITTVTWDLARFVTRFKDFQIGDLTPDDLRRYLVSYQEQSNLSPHTHHLFYRNLNTLFNWCEREDLLRVNPMKKVKPPHIPQTLPKVLTADEIRRVFAYVRLDKSRLGKRDFVILSMLLDTGLRSNELATLSLNDVHLEHSFLLVRNGKGKKDRVVPLSNTLRKLLWKYLSDTRPKFYPDGDRFFYDRFYRPISNHCVGELCRRVLRDCHIANGSAHIFRHTFATLYLRNGGDLERLRQILGHSSLTTTQIYLHLVPNDLIARHSEISPLASFF